MKFLNASLLKRSVALQLVVFATSSLLAFADTVGFVDYNKIRDGYEAAQTLIADIKVKDAELRKTQADYIKRIEDSRKANAKNPVATKSLETQLGNQLQTQVKNFRDWQDQELERIDNNVNTSIKVAAQRRGVNVVVDKASVVYGGIDLTADVIRDLNAKP